jgi:hypothetical protein
MLPCVIGEEQTAAGCGTGRQCKMIGCHLEDHPFWRFRDGKKFQWRSTSAVRSRAGRLVARWYMEEGEKRLRQNGLTPRDQPPPRPMTSGPQASHVIALGPGPQSTCTPRHTATHRAPHLRTYTASRPAGSMADSPVSAASTGALPGESPAQTKARLRRERLAAKSGASRLAQISSLQGGPPKELSEFEKDVPSMSCLVLSQLCNLCLQLSRISFAHGLPPSSASSRELRLTASQSSLCLPPNSHPPCLARRRQTQKRSTYRSTTTRQPPNRDCRLPLPLMPTSRAPSLRRASKIP